MAKKVTAILTAAGTGSRFKEISGGKSKTSKQFIRLFNKPVILYSLLALQKCKAVSEIIVTSNRENFELLHSMASKNKITKFCKLTEGGNTRAESVRNAFRQIESTRIESTNDDLILIHDAARPNITSSLLDRIIKESGKSGSVIIGAKISETVKRFKNGFASETLDRNNLWAIQTPQIFPYKILSISYKKIRSNKILTSFTDESSMVESAGYKVKIIEGPRDNIKITTREDLDILRKLMKKAEL